MSYCHIIHWTLRICPRFSSSCTKDYILSYKKTRFALLSPLRERGEREIILGPLARTALLGQLVRIRNIHLALPVPKGPLLLGRGVLNPHLLHVGLAEPAHEMGVPELGADAEVLAAAHEGVGFAALDGGGELFGGEVAVFALGLGDEAEWC